MSDEVKPFTSEDVEDLASDVGIRSAARLRAAVEALERVTKERDALRAHPLLFACDCGKTTALVLGPHSMLERVTKEMELWQRECLYRRTDKSITGVMVTPEAHRAALEDLRERCALVVDMYAYPMQHQVRAVPLEKP